MKSGSKKTKNLVIFLFILTVLLTASSIFVSQRLEQAANLSPDQSQAAKGVENKKQIQAEQKAKREANGGLSDYDKKRAREAEEKLDACVTAPGGCSTSATDKANCGGCGAGGYAFEWGGDGCKQGKSKCVDTNGDGKLEVPKDYSIYGTQKSCSDNGGFWCSFGSCISGRDKTCNDIIVENGGYIVTGANYMFGACSASSRASGYFCECPCSSPGNYQPPRAGAGPGPAIPAGSVCFNRGASSTGGQSCDGTQCGALCDVYSNSEKAKMYTGLQSDIDNGTVTAADYGTPKAIWFCSQASRVGLKDDASCDESTGGVKKTSVPACFCGTIQVDTGSGYKSYTMQCGCGGEEETQAPTPTPPQELCGNGQCNAGEACDGGSRCTGGGDFATNKCRSNCTYCGDGVVQAGEQCDDGNMNNTDSCSNSCTTVIITCGNNQCNAGETCDTNTRCTGGGDFSNNHCRSNCTYCGDGLVQVGEQCDDGNMNDNDGCTNRCTVFLPNCGNNICNPGETCDTNTQCTGGGVFTPGECRATCTYCGDGLVQAGEQCDDGNTNDNDNCNNQCRANVNLPYCGDGVVGPGEECEPGQAGSCGPGGSCDQSCKCHGVRPGLCGSDCANDFECPSDNVCANGRCILPICAEGMYHTVSGSYSGVYSTVYSGQRLGPNQVCAANGCELTQCGGPCGVGGACPSGMTCSTNNTCVITFCALNPGRCTNPCILPPTALVTDEIDIVILAVLLTLAGIVIYQTDAGTKAYMALRGYSGDLLRGLFNKKSQKSKFEEALEEKVGGKKK